MIDDDASNVRRVGNGAAAASIFDLEPQTVEPRNLGSKSRSFVLTLSPFGEALGRF